MLKNNVKLEYDTTLASQLLDSIDAHLNESNNHSLSLLLHRNNNNIQMEHVMSVDRSDDSDNSSSKIELDDDDNGELWLSGHRSIFSSYGDHIEVRKTPIVRERPAKYLTDSLLQQLPSKNGGVSNSVYEGFHWDLYDAEHMYHLAFDQQRITPDEVNSNGDSDNSKTGQSQSLSDWSMRLSSTHHTHDTGEDTGDEASSSSITGITQKIIPDNSTTRTSWHQMKERSTRKNKSSINSSTTTDDDEKRENSPLTLYRLFQRTRSQQPHKLYQNFSDKSVCDSLSSTASSIQHPTVFPCVKLSSPTTFSKLKLNGTVDNGNILSSLAVSNDIALTKNKKSSLESNKRKSTSEKIACDQSTQFPLYRNDQSIQTSLNNDSKTYFMHYCRTNKCSQTERNQSLHTNRYSLPTNLCYGNDGHLQSKLLLLSRSKSLPKFAVDNTKFSSQNHQFLPKNVKSLPNLDFLNTYDSTTFNQIRSSSSNECIKKTINNYDDLNSKKTKTVFYCINTNSNRSIPFHSQFYHKPRTLKEIKRIKNVKTVYQKLTSPTATLPSPSFTSPLSPIINKCEEEEEASLSGYSQQSTSSNNSTSSSGYFSNAERQQQQQPITTTAPTTIAKEFHTPHLKSCLKRAKTEDLTVALTPIIACGGSDVLAGGVAGDIFTLAAISRIGWKNTTTNTNLSRQRRYSAPTYSSLTNLSNQINVQLRTRRNGTLSEHDLRTKKSVSFCENIIKRVITPSASPKHRPLMTVTNHSITKKYTNDTYEIDLLPAESFTDSPPSEFNLSAEEEDETQKPMNYIESKTNILQNNTTNVTRAKKNSKSSIDIALVKAFANTVLRILEIKCGDQSYYLNNNSNQDLDRTLRNEFCPQLREVLEDGLKQHAGSLFSKKITLWRIIDLATPQTPQTRPYYEAKIKAQYLQGSSIDWTDKFNAFIFSLLNFHELTNWLNHFIQQHELLMTYYESSAFVLVYNENNDIFECLTNQLEKLSPLPFRLKYSILNPHVLTHYSPTSSTSSSSTNTTNDKIHRSAQQKHNPTTIPTTKTHIQSPSVPLTRPTSLLPKRFNVRAWLRDRKNIQGKVSPKEHQQFVRPIQQQQQQQQGGHTNTDSNKQNTKPVAIQKCSVPTLNGQHLLTKRKQIVVLQQ
ncbi:unnamed protein product [Didymodactylos carnosus]|uniref:RUN domain-containing protein n=1 Tax=Didymodactylos carnosus TaxID=1234261 RepID=A0A813NNF4_9BILA|nr:unnamed protein product [Didymodactylos carnosus]CAF0936382.1 unnamed protein product [Didymodactylos carnosus]CAF3519674.1 unnamed protein product [Didymodactylos carnosus]CAF3712018.1 unnamed protein product [Didymodactylos carnosus]